MKQINTLVKPTRSCNLRCKYCFHEKYGYSGELLDIDILKKYIGLLAEKYDYINLVWHGGEALLAPLDYFKEIYNFCDKQDANFFFSLQTNGTLLNDDNIAFFKDKKTNIGLSFDGINNDITRGKTSIILNNISKLQNNGFHPGAILVVNNYNVDYLIENYNYFKKLNIGMKINPMFSDGAATKDSNLALNYEKYVNKFVGFFRYWASDVECNIGVSTCEEYVRLLLTEYSGICSFNSCLGKWLCLDSDGQIYPCDRLCISEYNLGNVCQITNIDEVFENKNFIKLLQLSIERRKKCINECGYYKNCYGGCNANAILDSSLNSKFNSCYIQRQILNEVKNIIMHSDIEDLKLNSKYRRLLKEKKN